MAEAAKYAEKFRRAKDHPRGGPKGPTRRRNHPQGRRSRRNRVRTSRSFPPQATPRATASSLYKDKFLFTGDHLWWRRKRKQLGASQGVAWYSWRQQTESMEKLLRFDFEWVLPGHGQMKKLPPGVMRRELSALIQRMKTSVEGGWGD